MTGYLALLMVLTGLCTVFGVAAWIEEIVQKHKDKGLLPTPHERAVVGETHKPWM